MVALRRIYSVMMTVQRPQKSVCDDSSTTLWTLDEGMQKKDVAVMRFRGTIW